MRYLHYFTNMFFVLYALGTREDWFNVMDALLDFFSIVLSFTVLKQSLWGSQKMVFLLEFLSDLNYLFVEAVYFFVELGSLEVELVL